MTGLEVDEASCATHLSIWGPFAATERVLTALVRTGADRQEMHERLRRHSMSAWDTIQAGKSNPLHDLLMTDTTILRFIQPARIQELLDASAYVGLASERARDLAAQLRERMRPDENPT